MAVRVFDGVDDVIVLDEGALDTVLGSAFTIAVLFKKTAETNDGFQFLVSFNAGVNSSQVGSVGITSGNAIQLSLGGISRTWFTITNGVWYLVVVKKAAGTATPRANLWSYGSSTWVGWTDASDTLDASGTTVVEVRLGNGPGSFPFAGKMGGAVVYSSALSDTNGETLEDTAGHWFDLSPAAMWRLNQASTSTAVTDDTTGLADQTSLTGTTVDTGDDPAFDFDIVPPEPTPTPNNAVAGGLPLWLLAAIAGQRRQSSPSTGPTVHSAQASLAVTATLSAAVTGDRPASASLAVTTTLAATAVATRPAAASLAATATLTAAATRTATVDASLAVTAALTAGAQLSAVADASLPVTATLTATTTADRPASASLAATATLVAAATRTAVVAASLAATASLTAGADRPAFVAASLAATATLTAEATVGAAPITATASLSVTATLDASALRSALVDAALAVTASLAAAAAAQRPAAATLAVDAALTAASLAAREATGGLLILATLVATAEVTGSLVARPGAGVIARSATTTVPRPFAGTVPR